MTPSYTQLSSCRNATLTQQKNTSKKQNKTATRVEYGEQSGLGDESLSLQET